MNDGKRWEQNFKDSLGLSCIRLYDTTNGFSGVRNPCDFIYYRYPYQYLFELKSTKDKSLYLRNSICFLSKAIFHFNTIICAQKVTIGFTHRSNTVTIVIS